MVFGPVPDQLRWFVVSGLECFPVVSLHGARLFRTTDVWSLLVLPAQFIRDELYHTVRAHQQINQGEMYTYNFPSSIEPILNPKKTLKSIKT